MDAHRRNSTIARAVIVGATLFGLVAAAPLASFAPTAATAKGTRVVRTGCCDVRAPAFLKFTIDGDHAEARGGDGLIVEFGRRLSADPGDLLDGEIDSMGGGWTSYRHATARSLAKSGTLYDRGTVFAVRAAFDRGCGDMGLLTIRYPVAKKAQYGALAAAMSTSFAARNCR